MHWENTKGTKPKTASLEQVAEAKNGNQRGNGDRLDSDSIIECIADAIIVVDIEGNIKQVNRQTEKYFGYTRDELVGQKIEQLIPEQSQHQHIKYRNDFISNPRIRPMGVGKDLKARRKDGTEFPCAISLSPLKIANDTYIISSLRDITEQKLAKEYLLKYEHIVSASVDLLAFFSKNYIYQAVNNSYLDYFGKSRGEVIGHHASEVLGQEVFENQVKPNMDRCLSGQIVNFQIWLNYKKKGRRYMDAFYSPYRESDGSVTGIAVDIRDITGIKQAEEEASMHRERLAHLARVQTLGEMATGIAHEINQPLAAIDSYAQASQRHLQTGQANNDKVAELIEKISGQAKRAGSIVSRLRSMMQRRTVNPIPIDINTLLNEVSKIAEIDTRHHNCRLILKLTPSLPNVIGDEIQIQQVALNLIRNAVDAMDGLKDEVEKEIIVKTKRKDNKEVEVSVTDCGFGVTKLDADNIFEAFYTTKDSGLGMGLSICKSIIEDHGGEIGFMQNKAGGATFYFSLPIDKQEV